MTERSIGTIKNIQDKYSQLSHCLNEKSRRIWVATEAKSLGRGGISIVHSATGIDYKTIRKGLADILLNSETNSIRQRGGGRKSLIVL